MPANAKTAAPHIARCVREGDKTTSNSTINQLTNPSNN